MPPSFVEVGQRTHAEGREVAVCRRPFRSGTRLKLEVLDFTANKSVLAALRPNREPLGSEGRSVNTHRTSFVNFDKPSPSGILDFHSVRRLSRNLTDNGRDLCNRISCNRELSKRRGRSDRYLVRQRTRMNDRAGRRPRGSARSRGDVHVGGSIRADLERLVRVVVAQPSSSTGRHRSRRAVPVVHEVCGSTTGQNNVGRVDGAGHGELAADENIASERR